jgi:LmbE family N-acetylglucosaminyl deacetylase
MKRLLIPLLLVLAALCAAGRDARSETAGDALEPPSTGGLAALDPLLQKLTNNRRLLVIGAHPDDENTALLALVSKKMGGEAAYLSLSRGEGGQNLIGDELGPALGLVRSQELAAARRLDGARQFFTRAYDFGFTRSLEETFRRWPKPVLLEDAVRIIRRFRPQVVFSTFSGTDRDGHGQHQASAIIAKEAFEAARDPKAFPELASEGLFPWAPKTLLRSNWFDRDAGFPLPTGDVDPVTGRSYQQIAMASRSLHRSQDMGMLQPAGPAETGAIWVAGGEGPGTKELFAGIDTRVRSIAAEIADAGRRAKAEALLDRVEKRAEETRRALSPTSLSDAMPGLIAILADLSAARELARSGDGGTAALLEEKIAAAEAALAASAQVTLDAISEAETASGGETLPVTASVWNAGGQAVEVTSVALESADGWTVPPPAEGRPVGGKLEEWKLSATIPAESPATIPYFLRKPLRGDLYDWSGVAVSVRGKPFQPPPLTAVAVARIGGATVRLSREVTYRFRDEATGEVRRPLRAVPELDVAVEPELIVWPLARREKRAITVTVTSNCATPLSGRLEITPPKGWPAAAARPFALSKKGERAVFEMPLTPPVSPPAGRSEIALAASLSSGEAFSTDIRLIEYPHIRPTSFAKRASVSLSAVDLVLPRLSSVGYVRGASDRVPEGLAGVGVPIHLLTAAELERGGLSRYDAIVVGPRAYETDPALARANGRLLEYAREGGLVIVQYQQYRFVERSFAPAPLEIARPHDRVTDETAPVEVLRSDHPILQTPNRIGPADWQDWVQERGLYFAHSWDPTYTPLLSLADPGGPKLDGSLLVARLGKGRYVYTGLAFFRQIPAGIPGAYRLFANLLAWK